MADPRRSGERLGVVPFEIADMNHALVAAILSVEGGIGVRNGCFCAHPYILQLLRVSPEQARPTREAIRHGDRRNLPGLVRVSFGCYNNKEEINRLLEMLSIIASRRYRGKYTQDVATGDFIAEGYTPDILKYFTLGF